MIQAERILALLAPHDFRLAWEKWLGGQFNFDFVRPSGVDGVYEHIDIDSMGKRGECVYCRVFVSPLRGHRFQFKPTPEVDEVLLELADPAWDRRYTLIESTENAQQWEARVADIAPKRVRDLAEQHAEGIHQQTASARVSAKEYVARIREFSSEPVMEYLAVQLETRKAPERSSQPCDFGGLLTSQEDLANSLQCAAIAISQFGLQVDPELGGFQGESASRNQELRLRLDLIADLLRNGA